MAQNTTRTSQLLAEIVRLRGELDQAHGRPAFIVPETEVPALMTRYALETSGVVLRASDTGREWTLLGSRGWVLTYDPSQATS